MNVAEYIEKTVSEHGNRTCVVEAEQRLTFAEVQGRASRLAHYLVGAGVRPGDRVAVFQVNCFQFAEMIYAVLKVGAIVVTLNFRLRSEETIHILNDSGAKVLIAGDRYMEMINSIRQDIPALERILCMGVKMPGTEDYERILESQSLDPAPTVHMNADDGACIIYTSGTTGLPKGAVITHGNLSTITTGEGYVFDSGTLLINVPMYHIAGITSILLPMFRGDAMIMLPAFDPGVFLETVEREKVKATYLVPTMLQAVLDHPDFEKRDTGSLTHIGYGASPMPVELLMRAKEVLNADFTNYFGMTETTGIVSVLNPEDHRLEGNPDIMEKKIRRLAGIGRSIPEGEVRVVDDEDKDVSPGEVGEIIARSPKVMKGYWRNDEATKEALRGGWMHTGDLASMDEDGYLYLQGRKKDMIIRGGENIYPVEIESVLLKHPKVEEAAVIGVPDAYWGEIVKAVLVLKEGRSASEEEIVDFCRDRLASYKKPSIVEFRESLPRNAMQKVLKTSLREESQRMVK